MDGPHALELPAGRLYQRRLVHLDRWLVSVDLKA
jgi:hypothetical protein